MDIRDEEIKIIREKLAQHPILKDVIASYEYWLDRYEKAERPSELFEVYISDMTAMFEFIIKERLENRLCFRSCLRVEPHK